MHSRPRPRSVCAQTRDEIFPRIAELEAAEQRLMAQKIAIAKELIATPPSSELQAQVKKLSALLTKNNEDSDQLKKRRKRVEPTVREREAELQPVIASAYRAQVRVNEWRAFSRFHVFAKVFLAAQSESSQCP
jgi:hypothetical protein